MTLSLLILLVSFSVFVLIHFIIFFLIVVLLAVLLIIEHYVFPSHVFYGERTVFCIAFLSVFNGCKTCRSFYIRIYFSYF